MNDEHVNALLDTINDFARAITPRVSKPAPRDAAGGHVGSLTEAVMGVTAGLCKIADAIDNLSAAVRENKNG